MEPPVVPMSPRRRLVRDYSSEDDVPRLSTRPRNNDSVPRDGKPRGYDVDGTIGSRNTSFDLNPEDNDSRQTSFRQRSPNPQASQPRSFSQASSHGYQDVNHSNGHTIPPEDLRKLDFNLEPITETMTDADGKSDYAPSLSSIGPVSQTSNITQSSGSRLPDFFAGEVFQIVLHNPTTAHQLLKFSQSRLCGENMEFLEKVDRYHTLLNDVAKTLFEIHRDFISTSAPQQINIPESLLTRANKDLKTSLSHTLPRLESVFVDSQSDIERLVSMDIYPRFVRHQMTMSAAKALATDKSRYAGLGDCFVLTDPAKADNPIVFASDGFVKVTGYARNEIIPRNCRFLQTKGTDRAAVKRLKMSIDKREESVELLLNQKKNGEPFWNLLYTTPLFDSKGNVVFFLGGQINCSTTIHSASDILKILASSADVGEEKEEVSGPTPAENFSRPRYSRLFSGFRNPEKKVQIRKEAGMEGTMIKGMEAEKMNLKKQMDVFYTAYSKFMIVNYTTMFITFHSGGIVDLLYPAQAKQVGYGAYVKPSFTPNGASHASVAGQDVFKFLAQHSSSASLPSGFKSKVKDALRRGQAVSVDLTLCTRRYMGFEKFAVHWTPLKDAAGRNGEGDVQWVVLSLGGSHD